MEHFTQEQIFLRNSIQYLRVSLSRKSEFTRYHFPSEGFNMKLIPTTLTTRL